MNLFIKFSWACFFNFFYIYIRRLTCNRDSCKVYVCKAFLSHDRSPKYLLTLCPEMKLLRWLNVMALMSLGIAFLSILHSFSFLAKSVYFMQFTVILKYSEHILEKSYSGVNNQQWNTTPYCPHYDLIIALF